MYWGVLFFRAVPISYDTGPESMCTGGPGEAELEVDYPRVTILLPSLGHAQCTGYIRFGVECLSA